MSLLQDEVTEERRDASPLNGHRTDGDGVLLTEIADLAAEDGHRYGRREVRVSRDKVALYDPAGVELLCVPMADITSARVEPLVGGGRLEVTTNRGIVPIAEFTSAISARFSEMARGIEQLAKGEALHIKWNLERTRCAKCGRLLPEKDGRCPACVKRMAVLGRILSYMAPYKSRAVIVALMSLGTTVASLANPTLISLITDRILNTKAHVTLAQGFPMLLLYVSGMLVTLACASLFDMTKGWNVAYLSGNIAKDIRNHVYRCLEHLQLTFYDKKQVGAITSRVTQDTDRIWGFLVDGVPYLVTSSLMLVGTALYGLVVNWRLTLAIMAPVPIVGISAIFFWRPMSTLFYRVGQKWGRFHTHLNESVTGIRMVKAFAQEGRELDKFDKRNRDLADAGIRADRRWYLFSGAMTFFTGWGALINWTFGGYLVLTGQMSFGNLLAAQMLLWQIYGPLQWFAQVNQWFSRAMAGAERIFEVIDAVPEAYDRPDAVRVDEIRGDVTFDNVRFGYDKSNPVLKDICVEVKAGEMIGLVGKSGAGKSTTMSLLCRFYEADAGALKVDGIDVRDLSLHDLRRHIGVVPQDPFLFDGTIAENIAYGKAGATREEIMAAARAACAHDFIAAKPDGYDTQVGEKGNKLSGGEKQRVAIARAILHNPRILILDEATSSVDVETEKKIQQALSNLVRGRTTFAIAHRLSTLRSADRLVVLDQGKVVEVGTHAELMEKNGEFAKLVETYHQTSNVIGLAA